MTESAPHLFTIGHGTATQEEFTELLRVHQVQSLVDVRFAPGSRRSPHFGRAELEMWIPASGAEYRWERDLGGFRKPRLDSKNVGLRNSSFRGYADYMGTKQFASALTRLIEDASRQSTAVMCSESLWWRCHRRLISDALVLLHGFEVEHMNHDCSVSKHQLTSGARLVAKSELLYDAPSASNQLRIIEVDRDD